MQTVSILFFLISVCLVNAARNVVVRTGYEGGSCGNPNKLSYQQVECSLCLSGVHYSFYPDNRIYECDNGQLQYYSCAQDLCGTCNTTAIKVDPVCLVGKDNTTEYLSCLNDPIPAGASHFIIATRNQDQTGCPIESGYADGPAICADRGPYYCNGTHVLFPTCNGSSIVENEYDDLMEFTFSSPSDCDGTYFCVNSSFYLSGPLYECPAPDFDCDTDGSFNCIQSWINAAHHNCTTYKAYLQCQNLTKCDEYNLYDDVDYCAVTTTGSDQPSTTGTHEHGQNDNNFSQALKAYFSLIFAVLFLANLI